MRRTIEIPDDLYEEIKEMAALSDRSIAAEMRHLISTNNELIGLRAMKRMEELGPELYHKFASGRTTLQTKTVKLGE